MRDAGLVNEQTQAYAACFCPSVIARPHCLQTEPYHMRSKVGRDCMSRLHNEHLHLETARGEPVAGTTQTQDEPLGTLSTPNPDRGRFSSWLLARLDQRVPRENSSRTFLSPCGQTPSLLNWDAPRATQL